MERHLHMELEELRKELYRMDTMVIEAFVKSIRAMKEQDLKLAADVIENDSVIDRMEIDVDNKILSILALQQPVAVDFRFLMSALKINNDLERIADKAVTIARTLRLSIFQDLSRDYFKSILKMSEFAIAMVEKSFEAFMEKNARKAEEVIKEDAEIGSMCNTINSGVIKAVEKNQRGVNLGINTHKITTAIERIGALSKNISEDVLYYISGNLLKY